MAGADILEGDRGKNIEADESCEGQADDDGYEVDVDSAGQAVMSGSGHDGSFCQLPVDGLFRSGQRKTHISRFALIRGS
jgi:hypothetical protein